jgi:hypothetical protein
MSRLLLTLLLVFQMAQVEAAPAVVSGKTSRDGQAVAGVRVGAWPVSSKDFLGTPPHLSAPTGADGQFQLQVEPGEYYFLAESADEFSYYGRNPVRVEEGGSGEIKMSLARKKSAVPDEPAMIDAGVLVRVSRQGQPVAGVTLNVYTDLNSQLKGMGLVMSQPSDDKGFIELPLGQGTYFLLARQRSSGQQTGPLQAGDSFGYYAANPLVIKPGQVARVGIDLVEVPENVKKLAGHMFGHTSVSGRVLNVAGSPVAGVRVLLYTDSSMLNRPLYVSQPSNERGEYVLSFPKGGQYYLAARNTLGGAPGPGELYGRYTGSQDSSIRLESGQNLQQIDLLVEEMW